MIKHIAAATIGALVLAAVADAAARQSSLRVTLAPTEIRQGDVVWVIVDGARDRAVTATVFGQDLIFSFDEGRQAWVSLFGVDLDTSEGTYTLEVRQAGSEEAIERVFAVARRAFRERHLKVAPSFVDPPPQALAQIERDSKALAEVYSSRSPRYWEGPFMRPVEGRVNSNFGSRSFYNGEPRSPHAGVDFVAKTGTPIRAANRGAVVLAEPMYFTGNTVVIDHGLGLVSVFAHLSEIHVKKGEVVDAGTVVGLVGATGRVTGAHLHWSVRLGGARVDPMTLLAPAP